MATETLAGPQKARNASAEEIEAKLRKAREAFRIWRRTPIHQRIRAVSGFWRAVLARQDELRRVFHEETGKPLMEIDVMEVAGVNLILKHFARNAERILEDQPVDHPWILFNKRTFVRYIPRGVVGLITPWNYPLMIPFGDSIPALIAGNAVVIKPSEWTTKTAQFLETVAATHEEFPEGLFSVLSGDGTVGGQLIEAADMILFTGSTRTGRRVAQRCGELLKPAVLELGGKHPMIVLRDASLERASKGAAWGAFANMGQTCVGVERVFVERPVYDAFCAALEKEMAALRQGTSDSYDLELGRMIFPDQAEVVRRHLEDARTKGARVIGGGAGENPLALKPALVLDAKPEMLVMQEETFGPVLPVMPVSSVEEAVELANRSPLGLASSIWSKDTDRAEAIGSGIEAGMVGVNEVLSQYAVCSLPFGGMKNSGLGRRHGDEGLRMFCHTQSYFVHEWPASLPELWWFPYSQAKAKLVNFLTKIS